MPQPANSVNDRPTSPQAQVVATAQPPNPTPRRPASPTFRYPSYYYAKTRLHELADANGRGAVLRALDLYQELKHLADRTGHVRTTNDHLARVLKVKSRTTVFSAAKRLVAAGLIDLPRRTYDRRGYVNGLDYTVRFDSAYVQVATQQKLPLKSSTGNSSAVPAAPRPLTPATMKFVQVACWEVTNGHLAAKAQGDEVPDNLPDISLAVRVWLADHGATAAEAEIRAALEHVDRQRRRQQPLPLIGEVPRRRQDAPSARPAARRTAPRTTNTGAADLSLDATYDRYWAARYAAAGR